MSNLRIFRLECFAISLVLSNYPIPFCISCYRIYWVSFNQFLSVFIQLFHLRFLSIPIESSYSMFVNNLTRIYFYYCITTLLYYNRRR
ncbi:hypothetical protein HOY82DRAFT_555668 [Tuber indicum]|nr:hypothetical protein HOY82DRAFT_555668 [Tuber indicum]